MLAVHQNLLFLYNAGGPFTKKNSKLSIDREVQKHTEALSSEKDC